MVPLSALLLPLEKVDLRAASSAALRSAADVVPDFTVALVTLPSLFTTMLTTTVPELVLSG